MPPAGGSRLTLTLFKLARFFSWYVLAVALVHLLGLLVETWPLWNVLARIGWWCTPNRWLPIPWANYPSPFEFVSHADFKAMMLALPGMYLILSTLLLVLHALLLGVVMLIHWRFGRPAYLKIIKVRFTAFLGAEARHVWWILLTTVGLWLLARPVLDIIMRCWIDWPTAVSRTWAIWVWIGFVLLMAMHASATLRRMVLEQVSPDQLRCVKCGYQLFGLEERRCPECGDDRLRDGMPHYRLPWHKTECMTSSPIYWMVLRTVIVMVCVAGFISLWFTPPSALREFVQRPQFKFLKSHALLPPHWWMPPADAPAYFVKTGTVMILEDPNAVVAIYVNWSPGKDNVGTVAYWSPTAFAAGSPPYKRERLAQPDRANRRLLTWFDTGQGFSYLIEDSLSSLKSRGSERTYIFSLDREAHVWGFEYDQIPADLVHVRDAFENFTAQQSDPNFIVEP